MVPRRFGLAFLAALLALAAGAPGGLPSATARGGGPGARPPPVPGGPGGVSPAWEWLRDDPQPADATKWAPGLSDDERDVLAKELPATLALAITVADEEPSERRIGGSAFVASEDGILVTNWHILTMLKRGRVLWARAPGGEWVEARPIGATWWADVGMARLPPRKGGWPAVRWADASPGSLGRTHYAVGSPMGRPHVVSGGRLASLVYFDPAEDDGLSEIRSRRGRPKEDARQIGLHFSDALSMSGGSGSPVFDADGACVGIVSAGDASRPRTELAYVRPASLIRPLVELIRREARFDPPDLGVRLLPSPAPPGRPVSLPRELQSARRRARGGALVEEVRERGPAAGVLRPGDVLLEVAGVPVFGEVYESRALALLGLEPGVPCTLQVLRGGRRKSVEVVPRRAWSIYEDFAREHDARAPAFRLPGPR